MTGATTLKVHPEATQLSEEDLQQGVEILKSLQTVNRALRLEKAGDEQAIPMIVNNTFKNETHQVKFMEFLGHMVGDDESNRRKLVGELLMVCFEEVPAHSFS